MGDNDKEYKVEAIWNHAIYAKESKGYSPSLYYLVSWEGYPEEENTWEPASIVQHLWKLISTFYKDYLQKPIATSPLVNTAPLIARPTIKPEA